MAQQVSTLVYQNGETADSDVKTWLDSLTIASTIAQWSLSLSNDRTVLILAYNDS